MLPLWGDAALKGSLRDVDGSDFYHNGMFTTIPYDFFAVTLQQVQPPATSSFQQRLMEALGSKRNKAVMTLMIQDMNLKKEHVCFIDLHFLMWLLVGS